MTKGTGLSHISSPLTQSGTAAEPFHLDSLSINEVESFSALRIRALPGRQQSNFIGLNLPEQTGECIGHDPVTLCLRPNEWLQLRLPVGQENPDAPDTSFGPGLYRWNDSEGLGILRVTGAAAAWLMRKNSGLDFSVRPETPDHCAQCRFGKIRVLVLYRSDENERGEFNLVADRSLMNYLWTLLIATAPHAVELYKKFGTTRGRGRS